MYDKNYFITAQPNIYGNNELRDPQIRGFYKVYKHFIIDNRKEHAIVVLPTGVGKTGLIGLLPFHICQGRVLIITPQLTIRDGIVDSLDPDTPGNFWSKRKIFSNINEMPTLVEFDKTLNRDVLNTANIVVLNIHKLQSRLERSPLNFLEPDFFDMIIIDEAHHSAANTWVEATKYFNKAKVVKLTATPIRTDGVKLAGELVYKYRLSQAMAKGYVKSLRNFEYIPETLLLTIDNDETKAYTVEELIEQGIKDEDWVSRSVAYSKECSQHVVEESIKLLEKKRSDDCKIPHKIIAVACSIAHAEQIKDMYIQKGLNAQVIHSNQPTELQERIKKDISNHRIDVIINVSILGEGYDHPYLSVAAIFRPYHSELPYAQFIGRVLRSIPANEVEKEDDNIADIVSHKILYLQKLWLKYKIEIQESEVIKQLQENNELNDNSKDSGSNSSKKRTTNESNLDIGTAQESGSGILQEDVYLDTELIRMHKEKELKEQVEITQLQNLLQIGYEQALSIYKQTKVKANEGIKRPDLYFKNRKHELDTEIREIIVPELITKYGINQQDTNLQDCRLFKQRKYSYIKNRGKNNGAYIAMYFNAYFRYEIGKVRDQWTTSDYDVAFSKLEIIKEYVEEVLSEYMQENNNDV